MTDLAAAEQEHRAWIESACAAVGVDPAVVDVDGIHTLTKEVAHKVARPMAPVSSFIWGVALGRALALANGEPVDSDALRDALARIAPPTPRFPADSGVGV